MMRRQRLLLVGALMAAMAACTPGVKAPTATTPSNYSLLAAVIKSNPSANGTPGFGMPIAAVVPGAINVAARDRFLSAANLAVTQVYPSVLAIGGTPEDAAGQVLKLMAAAVGSGRMTGLSVSMDSEPLAEMNGLYVNFNADKKLKFGQAYRLVVTLNGKPVTAGLQIPKVPTILEPKNASNVATNADLTVRWTPQTTANAYQVDLAATGPGASPDTAYSSPYLSADLSAHPIPFKQFPPAGAASIYLTALGGITAADLAAGKSNVQGANGVAIGMTTVEQLVTLVPSGSDAASGS